MARPARRPGNLPHEQSSFVGRRQELADIRRRLADARLVSLVGPGGVGKTRLALRVATDLARGFHDGAWLVELADLRDGALVANAAVAALDLRDQAAADPLDLLLGHLRDKEVLIVVDNCEHLLEAAGRFAGEILRGAPGVRVLATSREPLSIAGEHVIPVPPLELPTRRAGEPIEALHANESVTLFVARAAAAGGAFELSADNRSDVVDLCRRLDGLPLAIELAAVRTRVLSAHQILERLGDRFALLSASGHAALPRHQTLRTTIDWSYDLLDENERVLFRRLCAFAGRFALDDAEAACSFGAVRPAEVLGLLASLVEKSLVIKEDARGIACFRLHETMREYALLRLREATEEEEVEERVAEHFRARALQLGLDSRYRLAEWLEWAELEIDNLRWLLRRYIARGRFAGGVDVAVALGWYWFTRATTEGAGWFDELLAAGSTHPETRAWAYFERGFIAVLQSEPDVARPHLARAVAEARANGQDEIVAQGLALSSIAAHMAGDRTAAVRLLDEARDAADGAAAPAVPIGFLQAVCMRGFFEGDVESVAIAAREGAHQSRESHDLYALEMMLLNGGYAAMISGAAAGAKESFGEALRIAARIDDRIAQYALLDALGCLAAGANNARLAANLLGAGDAIRAGAGAQLFAFLAPLIGMAEESIVAGLGRARFEAEFEKGKRLERVQAIQLALGDKPRDKPRPANSGAAAPQLTSREADVARLLADGLTNRQIGARLFLSERTVDSHVRSILNKLGVNNRAQIAAWAASAKPEPSARG